MPGDDIDAPVVVEALPIAVPPCSSVMTVNEFADHCANNVKLEVWPCVYGNEISVPPLAAANQPVNS
jgi:hypothetical protein